MVKLPKIQARGKGLNAQVLREALLFRIDAKSFQIK